MNVPGRARPFAAPITMCLAAALACSDVGPDDVPASIAFDALPYPAVVVGDSLRDESGLAVALSAAVFDARNVQIPDAPVRFLSLDPAVTISDDGHVTGVAPGTARVVAEIAGLQTAALTLRVTQRPDTMYAIGDTLIPIEYELPDVEEVALPVRVRHLQPVAEADTAVAGWIVRFAIVGQTPGDTTRGYLVRENTTVKASVDTTDVAGRAAMEYRLRTLTFPVVQDTLEVHATATYRGEPVAGSPVRFVLVIRPRPSP